MLSAIMDRARTPSADGTITLEGAFLAERAAAAGLAIIDIACVSARASWARAAFPDAAAAGRLRILPERELAGIAGYPFHRGVIAQAMRPSDATPEAALGAALRRARAARRRPLALWLPGLNDPENLGACFRNAAALGASLIILGPQVPDPLSPRALRVSMGASLTLPWFREAAAPDCTTAEPAPTDPHSPTRTLLRGAGFRVAACVLDPRATSLETYAGSLDPAQALALALGNEAAGLGDEFASACDDLVTLPMAGGTDSLNVATAAALFLYRLAGDATGSGATREEPGT